MVDRVHPLKFEDPESGGSQTDDFPTSLNKNEDYLDARGLTVQDGTSNDELVRIDRIEGSLLFHDKNTPGSPKTLSQLVGGTSIVIKDEDTNVSDTPHSGLNFEGAGVSVTDQGGGIAKVTIPGGGAAGVVKLNLDPGSSLIETTAKKVLVNGFPALEFDKVDTRFGFASMYWNGTPSGDVAVRVRFILKAVGSGTNVRIGVKVKARAVGEDTSTAFDQELFVVVPVTTTTIGEVFEATITIPAATFADGDVVSLGIGRDALNLLGAGTNDDFSKSIQIISSRLEIP